MIELYHGSNLFIDKIDFTKCKPYKDFGQGFYLTDIFPQAMEMAIKRTRIVGSGSPVVTKFLFDEKLLIDGSLKVLTFDSPSIEWAKFILANRKEVRINLFMTMMLWSVPLLMMVSLFNWKDICMED